MPPAARRLSDLLIDPHETLDVEHKEWIDIVGNNDHKATLAKALIALANHGGGFLIFGLIQTAQGVQASPNRPANLADYTPDTINAVVNGYAEPTFHCDLNIVEGPDGLQYPIVSVPGGHHVPIKAKRDGPNGQIVRQNTYYIRRPGPQSEGPQTGREWDDLIRRCISNARDQLVDQMRTILQGGTGAEPQEDDLAIATNWFESSMVRWAQLVATAAAGGSINFPNGHFAVSYRLSGNLAHLGMAALVEALGRATVRHTGWPEFTVMRRQEIAPYIHNGAVECWMARDGADHGPAHNDFWRASPDGNFFLIRGHQEDEARHGPPRSAFDITLPAWRVGEALLHASNMASELGDPAANVTMIVEWTGLAGRSIISLDHSRLLFADQHHAQQNTFRNSVAVQADQIRPSLPELVGRLIIPLYELFDFFRLPAALPAEEMTKMQRHQF
ncbi:MAG TPA: ATP-binding protein [Xanthobacteraceae bacterium]|nr:ATP-binding protein [Xanthobacteraceae bacterium]